MVINSFHEDFEKNLENSTKHKARLHRLYFIGELLQAKVKNSVFVKLDSRYADYFPEYSNIFGRALRLLNSMYGMTNSGNLFTGELKEWLLEECFIQSQYQMSTYYKYAPDGTKFVILYYVDDCVDCYTYEALVKWFVNTL